MLSTAESTKQTSVTCVFFRCGAHGRGVPCAATCRPSRLPAVFPACMGAGASPAPPPAALGLQNRAHWPLPPASSARRRRSRRSAIGARSSPPTPPMAVLLVARPMAVTTGGICLLLGRQDALLTAETRLWRDADERREREVEEQSRGTRTSCHRAFARWGRRAGWRGQRGAAHQWSPLQKSTTPSTCRSGLPAQCEVRQRRSVAPRNGTLTLQSGRTGTPTLMRCPDSQRGWIDFLRQPISVLDNDGQNGSENPPRLKLLRRRGRNRGPGWR